MKRSLTAIVDAIEAGADVDWKDGAGRTPLFYAAQYGDYDIVVELIERGADVNAPDKALKTPLHFAAAAYQPEVVDLLLRSGAGVDLQDSNGNTALFDSVFNSRGRGDVIESLIACGAQKSLENRHGVSPEALAGSIANYNVLKFFR
jgi:ankyrin repeat protein